MKKKPTQSTNKLTSCNQDIFDNGIEVFYTNSIPSNAMDVWVKQIAQISNEPVDWSFRGGIAVVKTTGNIPAVKQIIIKLLPEHNALQKKAYEESKTKSKTYGEYTPSYTFPDQMK